ncbi:hypothetical protein EJ06DRAFT_530488 [Trichodelitschia bisporula]|uniref:ATP synthase F(0) complex subunit e, mitochondrial n=1 Tax=Trichodelitschia bisporula TaxID=703511 RepID=A0A6G1HXF2_9PEZI|nr:hypothetical protein EJ06DRAFT_530488 [Trichodelitschia bisporula]
MASTSLNVLRWSALGVGVFYGAYHQSKISARDRAVAAKAAYENKARLISQAKAEYTKKTQPAHAQASGSTGSGFDFTKQSSGPDFDLEAFLHLK